MADRCIFTSLPLLGPIFSRIVVNLLLSDAYGVLSWPYTLDSRQLNACSVDHYLLILPHTCTLGQACVEWEEGRKLLPDTSDDWLISQLKSICPILISPDICLWGRVGRPLYTLDGHPILPKSVCVWPALGSVHIYFLTSYKRYH